VRLLGQRRAGQALDALVTAIRGGLDPTPILIVGQARTGKHTAALDLVRRLACLEGQQDSCECRSCRQLVAGHPDVEQVSLQDEAAIDRLRDLSAGSLIRRGRRKYVLVERLDRFTEQAVQTLLKILEEPKANTVWILTSRTEPSSTILSRVWTVRLGTIEAEVLPAVLSRTLTPVETVMAGGQAIETRDRFVYLQFVLDQHPDELLADKLDSFVLAADIRLASAAIVQAVAIGKDQFGPVAIRRLDPERAGKLVDLLDRAAYMLDNVRAWLVLEFLRNHIAEVIA
jgi:hypothetical protein